MNKETNMGRDMAAAVGFAAADRAAEELAPVLGGGKLTIRQECAWATEMGLTIFKSRQPCQRCGEARRYARQGQCVACSINRHVNRRAKAVLEGKVKPRGSKLALEQAMAAYAGGAGLVQSARQFGVGVDRLRHALKKAGLKRSQEDIKLERALKKVRAGMDVREAAAANFVPIVAIERVLVAEGRLDSLSETTDPELLAQARCNRALALFPAPGGVIRKGKEAA